MSKTDDGILLRAAPFAAGRQTTDRSAPFSQLPTPLETEVASLSMALSGYDLTLDQLRLVAHIVQPKSRGHGVDLKASVPLLLRKRMYVRLLFGIERRNEQRIRLEGQTSLHRVAFVQSTIVMLFFGYSAFGVLCSAYLLKSLLGVDLFDGPSPLHALFQAFIQ